MHAFLSYLRAAPGRWLPVVVLLSVAGCSRGEPGEETSPASVPASIPSASYVGDEACASCHEDTYRSYHRTGMGRSVSRFDPATAPERFDGTVVHDVRSGFSYQAFVRGDSLYQREFQTDASGAVIYERVHAVDWVIGSGNATRSYIMSVNGHLTEMPLTWYAEAEKWDMSPSYEQRNYRFERPIQAECMTCHNGLPGYSAFTEDHYTDVPLGITCERCHGPGGDHVDLHLAGLGSSGSGPDASIVNPAHLDRQLQLDVCQQCHLTGVTVFKPGHDMATYRPGTLLSGNRSVFAPAEMVDDPERFGIASQAERLARSACFQESAMTCTTCHDPHRPVEELGRDFFNQSCLSCHGDAGAPDAPGCSRDAGHGAGELFTGNCVSCHMQRGGTSDIPHVAFTDHWIRRTLPPSRPEGYVDEMMVREAPMQLVRLEGRAPETEPAMEALEEAIAYFKFYDVTHRLPDYLPDVVRTVERGLTGGAEHVDARLVQGRALLEQGEARRAAAVLAEAANRYPGDARLRYWLGVAYQQSDRPGEAAAALQRAVEIQPRFTEAHIKLGEALQASGRYDAAEAAYRAALAENPVHHPAAWNNLGFLYLQLNRIDEAENAFDRALALDPDLVVALANAGSIRLYRGDAAAAVALFERAVARDPDYVPALANLAMAYARVGRYDRAVATAERLVALQPDNPQARALLEQVRSQRAGATSSSR